MSMDIDTALYAVLRKDERGLAGLKTVTKAARMAKKMVSLLQHTSPTPRAVGESGHCSAQTCDAALLICTCLCCEAPCTRCSVAVLHRA